MSFRRAMNVGSRRKRGIPSGLYTYRGKDEFSGLALQLRIEPSGEALLVINANTVLYLNQSAATHAYFFMKGMSTEEAVKSIRSLYRVDTSEAQRDHEHLIYSVSTLAQTEEVCPFSYLEIEKAEPFSQELSAPIRMDLALTFRCQNRCVHCYTGGPRETPELSTSQWKQVITKLMGLGIFVITFTGGEPTLREDLPELLAFAQDKGVVTGLITNGRHLRDNSYVQALVGAGLDFVQVTLESHVPEIHDQITCTPGSWKETVDGIKAVVPTPIYVSTNTTLCKLNAGGFLDTIQFIHNLGVRAFGCNSLIYSGKGPEVSSEFPIPVEELRERLQRVLLKSRALEMKFNWFTPTQYCELNPLALELGIKSCSACRTNMCVGPQGEVYPCQSYFESLGNILVDDWQSIWNHPLCQEIRNHEYAPEKCRDCAEFSICGAGCPLELKEKGSICRGTH